MLKKVVAYNVPEYITMKLLDITDAELRKMENLRQFYDTERQLFDTERNRKDGIDIFERLFALPEEELLLAINGKGTIEDKKIIPPNKFTPEEFSDLVNNGSINYLGVDAQDYLNPSSPLPPPQPDAIVKGHVQKGLAYTDRWLDHQLEKAGYHVTQGLKALVSWE